MDFVNHQCTFYHDVEHFEPTCLTALSTHHLNSLVETLWPKLLKPLIRILGLIDTSGLALVFRNVVPSFVIQGVLLIWSVSNIVRNSLHVVSDFLIHNAGDIVDLGIFKAEFVAKVRVDLGVHC